MKTFFYYHFTELKFNFNCFGLLFISIYFIIYLYNQQILYLSTQSLIFVTNSNYFIFTNLTELFLLKFIISSSICLYIMFYIFILQFWVFLIPGVKKIQNYKMLKWGLIYMILNILFNLIFYKYIIPGFWEFLIKFKINSIYISISFEPKVYNHVILLFKLIMIFNICVNYLYLLIVLILSKIQKKTFIKYKKLLYFKILIVIFFFIPSDIFSQSFIILIILVIFESLIFFKIII